MEERFSQIKGGSKFRRLAKKDKKVKINKKFESAFKDQKFKRKYTVDKRGRPINSTTSEDLKRYYHLSSDENSSEDEQKDEELKTKKPTDPPQKNGNEENNEEINNDLNAKHNNDKIISKKIKKKLHNLKVDYARGESNLLSESSSDDEESEEDEEFSDDELIEHKWGELDNDIEHTEEATYRLALCNMDWDRIRAIDLMVLFNSFLPSKGIIKSVTIYPSEFGKTRMQEEEVKGPIGAVEDDIENDTEEGAKYHMEKLRQYQLNRLKYFYAIIICDSADTANKIYSECDGMEYESSASKIDLRFIPDDMTFDEEPKEVCEKLPERDNYKPRFFTTTALQQAKVDITWDETDPTRTEIIQKLNSGKFDEMSKEEIEKLIALTSDEDSEDQENNESEQGDDKKKTSSVNKYKLLLQELHEAENEKQNEDIGMEISWNVNQKEETEKLVKKKLDEKEDKTPFEKYLDKKKKRKLEKQMSAEIDSDVPSDVDLNDPYFAEEFDKPEFKKTTKQKKEKVKKRIDEVNPELELLLMNVDDGPSIKKDENADKESSKKKKKKYKKKEATEEEYLVNYNDARFSAVLANHSTPTNPQDVDTNVKSGDKMKRQEDENEDEPAVKKIKTSKKDTELSTLIKSVKQKTGIMNSKK